MGKVGGYNDIKYETQGFGPCDTQATYRSNWNSASCSVFKIGNESKIVIAGNTHNCNTNPYTDVYTSLWIFNSNRSRFVNKSMGIDWTSTLNSGAPKSQDYNIIETVQANIAIGDLDGDGLLDFVYPTYDGKIYAYNLKQQSFSGFPFDLNSGQTFLEFGSECVLADIDNNGKLEIIFTTWTQKSSKNYGSLYILSSTGVVLHKVSLPSPKSTMDYGGSLGAPTLIKDEKSGNLKIICQTIHAGVVLYEIPFSSNSKIYWGTGKGNFLRNGNYQDTKVPPTIRSDGYLFTLSFFVIILC